jgi:hypothetical protein
MYSLKKVNTLVSCGRDPARSLPFWRGFLLIPLILACFAFLPQAQAACNDACLPNFNTVQGDDALGSTSGAGNSAFGWRSLFFGTGSFNTAMGPSLILNVGDSNTAVGAAALLLNGDGTRNTAVGTDALVFNGFGVSGADFNGAFGAFALFNNSDGFSNNAMGDSALLSNITAVNNTAIGDIALAFNDSDGAGMANNNVAVGAGALVSADATTGNTDGSENTAVGTGAGSNVVNGFNNTYLGNFVGSVDPDGNPLADESSTIRIGDLSNGNGAGSEECYIGGIWNNLQPVGGSVVVVTLDLADDHLGYDDSFAGAVQAPQRGKPAPRGLQRPGASSQLQRQAMNGKVEKMEATVAQQQKQIGQQQKQIETLTAQLKQQAEQIQKVSAQLEMVRSAPRVVNNQ